MSVVEVDEANTKLDSNDDLTEELMKSRIDRMLEEYNSFKSKI
jgi:hypothetical protein